MPDVAFDSERHAQVSDDMSAGGRTNRLRHVSHGLGCGTVVWALDD